MIMKEGKLKISTTDPKDVFLRIYQNFKYKFLLESKDVSQIYGRLSLIGIDPVLKITGKNDSFSIESINKRLNKYLKQLNGTSRSIKGTIKKVQTEVEESQR